MKQFMGEDFLLSNGTAVDLFEKHAKKQPIIDWHCHLSPQEIWEDKPYSSLTRLWLGGDHYKWRAMRAIGVPERLITGDGTDYDKFLAWAGTLPHLIGNPLYHWSHLELRRFFGIEAPLCAANAPAVWERANELLGQPGFTPRGFIERSNVEAVCTTDDPADSLKFHEKLRTDAHARFKVLPAMRPDKALNVDAPGFAAYLARLGEAAGVEIGSFTALKEALSRRIEWFDTMGCRASDHGFTALPQARPDDGLAEQALAAALAGKEPSRESRDAYQSALMVFLAGEYRRRDWVMELHVGATRNNNRRMFQRLGPDTGYDAIGDASCAEALAGLLSEIDAAGGLPRTVLFNLNPKDGIVLAALMGCFQDEDTASHMQYGSAWWFLDNRDGMEAQLRTLANVGALSRFVGMVTDSRSFLSYPRHEYFRRILCDLLGRWVEDGEYPADWGMLGNIVGGICCDNARKFFRL